MTAPWIVAFVSLSLLVLVLAAVLFGLVTRVSVVLERAESVIRGDTLQRLFKGLEAGELAPPLSGEHVAGPALSNASADSPRLLLFVDDDCAPCRSLLSALERPNPILSHHELVLVIAGGGNSTRPSVAPEWAVLRQRDHDVSEAYRVTATPYAYAVSDTNQIVTGLIPSTVMDLEVLAQRLDLIVNGQEHPALAIPKLRVAVRASTEEAIAHVDR